MSNYATVASVRALSTEEGAWINDTLRVIVRNAKPAGVGRTNKPTPSKCVLVDPNNPQEVLNACWFGGGFTRYDDKIIEISGKGNKVSTYNGKIELTVGKEAVVALIGDAPSGAPPQQQPGHTSPPGDHGNQSPPKNEPQVDPATKFHRGMQKAGLMYAHAHQYAMNAQQILGIKFSPEQFQGCVGWLFSSARDSGALAMQLPKLRPVDPDGFPFRYIPEGPDPEEVKRKAEAAAKAAAAAAEAEARRRTQEQANLDEDVPF